MAYNTGGKDGLESAPQVLLKSRESRVSVLHTAFPIRKTNKISIKIENRVEGV